VPTQFYKQASNKFGFDPALSLPWLDTRMNSLACRWHDTAGSHLLELTGGPVAGYTGPDGRSRRLALNDKKHPAVCLECRAATVLRLYWLDVDGKELYWSFSDWNNHKPLCANIRETFTPQLISVEGVEVFCHGNEYC